MDLKECYEAIGGDFSGAITRLRSEKLVTKLVLKFLADPSFPALEEAMRTANQEEAFRAAHTLKGLSLNLGFTRLGDSSSRLTEALRNTIQPEAASLFEEVAADYAETASAIQALG